MANDPPPPPLYYIYNPPLNLNPHHLQNKVQSPTNAAANNPFLAQPTQNQNQSIVDLFGPAPATEQTNNSKASEDLLSLGNPFADMFGGGEWFWELLIVRCVEESWFEFLGKEIARKALSVLKWKLQ